MVRAFAVLTFFAAARAEWPAWAKEAYVKERICAIYDEQRSPPCLHPPFDRPTVYPYPDQDGYDLNALFVHDPLYVFEYYFQDSLRLSTKWRACDAAKASLLYVPVFYVRHSSNGPGFDVSYVRERIRAATGTDSLPLNRTVFIAQGDSGTCDLPPEFRDAVWLTPFGLDSCLEGLARVVVVPHTEWLASRTFEAALDRLRMGHTPSLLFTFYGGPHGAGSGARAALIEHWGNKLDRGFSVGVRTDGGRSAYDDIINSTFCGAPHGGGWGSRLAICILHGSIPVIVMDNTTLPLERVLDYSDFSLRVAVADVPRLEAILRAVSPERVSYMRRRVLEIAPYFIWDARAGGRAFEGVMHAVAAAQGDPRAGRL